MSRTRELYLYKKYVMFVYTTITITLHKRTREQGGGKKGEKIVPINNAMNRFILIIYNVTVARRRLFELLKTYKPINNNNYYSSAIIL